MSSYTENCSIYPGLYGVWVVKEPLHWDIGKKDSGLTYVVNPDFSSDLASIPSFARIILNPADSRFAKASILHDSMLKDNWSPRTSSAEFYEALIASGVKKYTAFLMYISVFLYTTLFKK